MKQNIDTMSVFNKRILLKRETINPMSSLLIQFYAWPDLAMTHNICSCLCCITLRSPFVKLHLAPHRCILNITVFYNSYCHSCQNLFIFYNFNNKTHNLSPNAWTHHTKTSAHLFIEPKSPIQNNTIY